MFGHRFFGRRHFGPRYFGGNGIQVEPPIEPPVRRGGGSFMLPRPVFDALRHQRIDEDDMLLILASCLDGNALLQ